MTDEEIAWLAILEVKSDKPNTLHIENAELSCNGVSCRSCILDNSKNGGGCFGKSNVMLSKEFQELVKTNPELFI